MNTNDKGIFLKIKTFFFRIFGNQKRITAGKDETVAQEIDTKIDNNTKKSMFEIAQEQNHYIELQKRYFRGDIKEKELSEQEVLALEKLFDEQIIRTERINNSLKKKIARALLENKDFIKLYHDFSVGEISENELTNAQIKQIGFVYDIEIDKTEKEIEILRKKQYGQ